MTTKILGPQIAAGTIQIEQLSANTTANLVNRSLLNNYVTSAGLDAVVVPKVTSVAIANSTFTILDDTAVDINGGYIVITGSNFAEGVTVLVGNTSSISVSRVNSTTLRVQVPAKAAASYNLFVVNPDGSTGIRASGITYSANPTWVTASPLSSQVKDTAFVINLNATEATSYTLAAGSSLPAGTALLANGYFYGTVSIAVDTTYSFDVVATDAQNQDSSKTFGLTVTVAPQLKLWSINGATDNPIQIGTDINWSKVSSGDSGGGGFAATKTNGTLWTWGNNNYGKLGLNDLTTRGGPVQVGTLTNWSTPKISGNQMLVIKTNGTLWACGQNFYGQNGTNDRGTVTNRSSPIQVGPNVDWFVIDNHGQNCVGIRTNGTLYGWGRNQYGHAQLNRQATSSPVQIGGAEWSKVSLAYGTVLAIKTNGTLWSWGRNSGGQLATNNIINRSSPVQVGTDTNWSVVSSGLQGCYAIKTNGTLWAWGVNNYGQLGLNDLISRSSPVQVGALTNWAKTDVTVGVPLAIKTDGTLWIWGNPGRSSPVQVGSNTGWTEVAAGDTNLIIGA